MFFKSIFFKKKRYNEYKMLQLLKNIKTNFFYIFINRFLLKKRFGLVILNKTIL